MPEIRDEFLSAPANRCVYAHRSETLNTALNRWIRAGGDNTWHLVVDWEGGEFRAIKFADLTDALAPALARDPVQIHTRLEALQPPIPVAKAVDRFGLGIQAAKDLARRQPTKLVVVTQAGKPVGIIYEGETWGAKGVEDLVSYAVPELQAGPPANTFDAYPALKAPDQVTPEETFTVTVGFSTENDPDLLEAIRLHIENPPPGAKFLVMLVPQGVKVLDGNHRDLPLDLEAHVTFTCQAQPGASFATLTAHFIYEGQLAGLAKRGLVIVSPGQSPTPIPAGLRPEGSPGRMSLPEPECGTDLQITLTHTRDGQLLWTFLAPSLNLSHGPVTTDLADAREFAGQLIGKLRTQNFSGPLAANILASIGQTIADRMPAEFQDILQQVYRQVGGPPTVLLHTDEFYIPWELARLDPPLDSSQPPYLAAQTRLGRWLLDQQVAYPPALEVNVKKFSAVASTYGLESGLAELKEAMAEQAALQASFGATPVEATLLALTPLLVNKTPGHLAHFAVHGSSDPQANESGLLLADQGRLIPEAMVGGYRRGDTPVFAFVFLNACQVGTAGASLGQAAGFPGGLVRGGVQGFVAPLWQVHDGKARELAEAFYDAALNGEGTAIAEIWQTLRNTYDATGSTTPLAYIYYGHPKLKLRYAH